MVTPEQIQKYLRSSTFLTKASEETIKSLSKAVELVEIAAGERIFEKHEHGSTIYIVVEGSVKVHDGDMFLTKRGEGEAFGEIGALASLPRTASVTAEIDSVLIQLDKKDLYETMAVIPEAAHSIIEALCQRESMLIHEATEQAVKARVTERELAIAQRIQRGFLPDKVPEITGWDLAGYLQPAREVAGDFYDLFEIPDSNYVGILIGDVCDKGVGAALFMTIFTSLIRSSSMFQELVGNQHSSAEAIIKHSIKLTNDYIATIHGKSSMFASVFYALLNPDTGQLTYINAGHEAPVIVNSAGIRMLLETTGPVIGLFTGIEHEVKTIIIEPGELLIGYTDGATDAKNSKGEQFSEERLLDKFSANVLPASSIMPKIVRYLEEHIGTADQYDDITIIAASRQGRGQVFE